VVAVHAGRASAGPRGCGGAQARRPRKVDRRQQPGQGEKGGGEAGGHCTLPGGVRGV